MKKTLTRLCAALLLTALAGCGTVAPPSVDSSDAPTEAVQTSPETEPQEPKNVTVAQKGESAFTIVRSDEANSAIVELGKAFRQEFNRRLGCDVRIGNDFVSPTTPNLPDAAELLVGDTNREESVRLKEKLTAAGGSRYGILVSDSKVAVAGTGEYATYLGLCHLMDEYIRDDGEGGQCLVLPAGFEWMSEEQTSDVPDLTEAKKNGVSLAFYAVERVIKLRAKDTYGTLQGGGTDGTYVYYAMINSATLMGVILKYDPTDWKLIKRSEPMPVAHCNDITYDSKNNRLVISYCHEQDNYYGICTINPDTLEFISYQKLGIQSRGIEYLPETNQFLLAKGYKYVLATDTFTALRSFESGWREKTTQGMCVDGEYIFDARWEKADVQYIDVNRLDGTWYGVLPFYGADGEPENIYRYGDSFYIGLNGSLNVWRVKLLPDKWW